MSSAQRSQTIQPVKVKPSRLDLFAKAYFVGINIFLGVVFILAGISTFSPNQADDGWAMTSGTTTGTGTNQDTAGYKKVPAVSYTVDGQTYQVQSEHGVKNDREIQPNYDVYYNLQNPSEAEVALSRTPPALGAIMIIAGVVFIVFNLIAHKRAKRRLAQIA